jgi:hypothetical protein
MRSNCYTNGGAAGFRRGRAVKEILSNWDQIGWSPREGDARGLLEIVDEMDVAPSFEKRRDGVLLAVTDLKGQQAMGFECVVGQGYEATIDVKAGFPREQGAGGFVVADLGVEAIAVGLTDIGRITDDDVEGSCFGRECG